MENGPQMRNDPGFWLSRVRASWYAVGGRENWNQLSGEQFGKNILKSLKNTLTL